MVINHLLTGMILQVFMHLEQICFNIFLVETNSLPLITTQIFIQASLYVIAN